MSSATSRAVMLNSTMCLSPTSILPMQPRIGVRANTSPSCGETTCSEPKYVRFRGGHFSFEMLTSVAVLVSVAVAIELPFEKLECIPRDCFRAVLQKNASEDEDGPGGGVRASRRHRRGGSRYAAGCGDWRSALHLRDAMRKPGSGRLRTQRDCAARARTHGAGAAIRQ